MPTYEYKCDACGYLFERFQSITADRIRRCPECGKAKVKRLIGTGAGLIFKGSGFYITDYRDKSYAEKAKAETGGGSSEAKSDAKPAEGGGSSESKPAAKAESAPATKGESKAAASKPKGEGKQKK